MILPKCAQTDCHHPAEVAVKILVPAKGFPPIPEQSLQLIVGLEICVPCFEAAQAKDFITDDIQKLFRIIAQGKAEPDFPNTYLHPVRLDSQEYLMLKHMQHAQQPTEGTIQ